MPKQVSQEQIERRLAREKKKRNAVLTKRWTEHQDKADRAALNGAKKAYCAILPKLRGRHQHKVEEIQMALDCAATHARDIIHEHEQQMRAEYAEEFAADPKAGWAYLDDDVRQIIASMLVAGSSIYATVDHVQPRCYGSIWYIAFAKMYKIDKATLQELNVQQRKRPCCPYCRHEGLQMGLPTWVAKSTDSAPHGFSAILHEYRCESCDRPFFVSDEDDEPEPKEKEACAATSTEPSTSAPVPESTPS